jgi:hypothetical protein
MITAADAPPQRKNEKYEVVRDSVALREFTKNEKYRKMIYVTVRVYYMNKLVYTGAVVTLVLLFLLLYIHGYTVILLLILLHFLLLLLLLSS